MSLVCSACGERLDWQEVCAFSPESRRSVLIVEMRSACLCGRVCSAYVKRFA